MCEYFQPITPIDITRQRRKGHCSPWTPEERTIYQALTGSLNWIGHTVLLQACFSANYFIQNVGRLKVAHLVMANKVLQELNNLNPVGVIASPSYLDGPCYLAFQAPVKDQADMVIQATSPDFTCRGERSWSSMPSIGIPRNNAEWLSHQLERK